MSGEFWLIDLGSSNGTFLNKRRFTSLSAFATLDQITVGDTAFTFATEEISAELARHGQQTIRETASIPVWLLVADIENFYPLSRSMVTKAGHAGRHWVSTCKSCRRTSGEIDKYLGDGFLAYWQTMKRAGERRGWLQKLKQLQK